MEMFHCGEVRCKNVEREQSPFCIVITASYHENKLAWNIDYIAFTFTFFKQQKHLPSLNSKASAPKSSYKTNAATYWVCNLFYLLTGNNGWNLSHVQEFCSSKLSFVLCFIIFKKYLIHISWTNFLTMFQRIIKDFLCFY